MARASLAVAIVLALAGCAAAPTIGEPYVGVFTGQYVDGKPLYRLPSIEVIGTRRGADAM
jgi:hypothetical protein